MVNSPLKADFHRHIIYIMITERNHDDHDADDYGDRNTWRWSVNIQYLLGII